MVKKILLFIYLTFLGAITISSIYYTWQHESSVILGIEIAIDLIIVGGVVLYFRKIFFKPWVLIFIIALILQIVLLTRAPYIEPADSVLWLLMLAPAVYMNIVICGLFKDDEKDR